MDQLHSFVSQLSCLDQTGDVYSLIRLRLILATLLVTAFFAPESAISADTKRGVFIEVGEGSGYIEFDNGVDFERDIESEAYSLGYVFDSPPNGPSLSSNRLNIGIGAQAFEDDESEFNVDWVEARGFYMDNTFGFHFLGNHGLRWWGGPSVRLGLYSGEHDPGDNTLHLDIALGATTGVNIDLDGVIISPSLAYRSHHFYGYSGHCFIDDFAGSHEAITFNLALLF
ncbi:hypothetical protein [Halorhodospira halochloris]|uniref:hypothetical protein n=1 Tax=Halorhodospira halochloris TaxID=1052 RepID=UPI001EE95CD1|nr:hypothetical protein [Halorhodospira halochloris]MCG5547567.1 hypothetical protein [Halorhodospira halochloris]